MQQEIDTNQSDVNDVTKNESILKSSRPKSGRLIKEDYSVINIADAVVIAEDGKPAVRAKFV